MHWLPGWGSVEATRTIRDSCELAGLALFAVVMLLEAGSYCYAHRHDVLADTAARTAQARLQVALEAADRRHAADESGLRQELAHAQAPPPVARPAPRAPRRLTEVQKSAILIALAPFAGQPISFASVIGDPDGETYKVDFVTVVAHAKWAFDPGTAITQAIIQPEPVGVQVAVNQGDMEAGSPPSAVTALVQTFDTLGITSGHTVYLSPEIPSGAIRLIIGLPPPG